MSHSLIIDIVSDYVCPWCYVGKKRLEKAIAELQGVDCKLNWLPFQLSPDMPREGRPRSEHYAAIFGPDRAEQIMSSMRDTGAEEGIVFGSSPDAMSPNTLSAHTLMFRAQQDPTVDSNALAEALFSAHHVDCADIGRIDVLAGIAAQVGMDEQGERARLAAGTDEDRVQQLISQAVARGVSGVPFFIINDRYGLSGAQPPEVLAETFRQVAEQAA